MPPVSVGLVLMSWMTFGSDPRLNLAPGAGGYDFRTIEEKSDRTLPVRHTRGLAGSWSVAETANFRLFHQQRTELAEKAAQVVEQTRSACCRKWFGVVDEDWTPRCDVYMYSTGLDYARATGVSAQVPAFSTTDCRDGRVTVRRIDLHCDVANLLTAILPHEVTHAVMAGKFGDGALPHWANEAMAVLTEPREVIEIHLRDLPRYRRDGLLFPLVQLLARKDYPPPHLSRSFHAQSVSLVEMLANKKGPQVFAQFLRDGLRGGYEPALERHYGYDFAALEQTWLRHAFAETAPQLVRTAAERRDH